MRALIILLFAALATPLSAQDSLATWEGYLADQMCAFRWRGKLAETYAKRHTRECSFDEKCMASGYGILSGDTFIKFTQSSSPVAIAYLESITKNKNIYVRLTGQLKGEKLLVAKIETATKDPDPR
jgi:hypothetical protein